MPEIVKRFFGFDTLLGVWLVKVVYFMGLAGIAGGVVIGFFMLIMTVAGGNLVGALVQLIAVPVVAAVALVYWRFLCEIFMVQFENHDRLIEIRERLGNWQF
ncbi:MAG TPA: DUF4282 domain-containing protein [Caulobacterales bacterium]|nr:DUF4282 domain-containing protein [Caulobacterales bacterium]